MLSEITLEILATSHENVSVGGIGSTAKCIADILVTHRKVQIYDATSLC